MKTRLCIVFINPFEDASIYIEFTVRLCRVRVFENIIIAQYFSNGKPFWTRAECIKIYGAVNLFFRVCTYIHMCVQYNIQFSVQIRKKERRTKAFRRICCRLKHSIPGVCDGKSPKASEIVAYFLRGRRYNNIRNAREPRG